MVLNIDASARLGTSSWACVQRKPLPVKVTVQPWQELAVAANRRTRPGCCEETIWQIAGAEGLSSTGLLAGRQQKGASTRNQCRECTGIVQCSRLSRGACLGAWPCMRCNRHRVAACSCLQSTTNNGSRSHELMACMQLHASSQRINHPSSTINHSSPLPTACAVRANTIATAPAICAVPSLARAGFR